MYSFIKVSIYVNKTLSGRLRELKNKGKVQLGNLKSGRDRLRERSDTRAFHYKVKVTVHSSSVHRWSFLVAYESGRKESFDCMILGILKSLFMLELELIRIGEI